ARWRSRNYPRPLKDGRAAGSLVGGSRALMEPGLWHWPTPGPRHSPYTSSTADATPTAPRTRYASKSPAYSQAPRYAPNTPNATMVAAMVSPTVASNAATYVAGSAPSNRNRYAPY